MSEHDQLITQFVAVTGIETARAKFYLESAAWNLDVAIESFYDDGGDDDPAEIVDMPASQAATASASPKLTPGKQGAGGGSSRFATISNIRDQGGSDEEEGEAFYAGGSETSGQQILGPSKKKKNTDALVEDMFKAAKEHGAEEIAAGPSSERKPAPLFKGTGYRLGDEEGPSHVVMGAPVGQGPHQVDMVLKLWKDGFSVDNGELRDYRDPKNNEFLDAIHKGEVPRELVGKAKGGEVNLNMEDHRQEDFVKPKVDLKAFSGAGHMLGSPTPTLTTSGGASGGATPQVSVNIDASKPTTQLQLRLADGTRLVAKFNHTHTVADIRQYIISNRPDLGATDFVLMTTFPNKELTDETVTLEEAKLLNAVIVQRKK